MWRIVQHQIWDMILHAKLWDPYNVWMGQVRNGARLVVEGVTFPSAQPQVEDFDGSLSS
jgi:hypothetical protein